MSTSSKYPRDAGSRTMLDVIFNRTGDPSDDVDAVFSRGEGRAVTCFLRSTIASFPDTFRYGVLRIDDATVTWAPGAKGKGTALTLETPLDVRRVRTPGEPGEGAIKTGALHSRRGGILFRHNRTGRSECQCAVGAPQA